MLTNHQEELYNLYKEIDKICKEHGIKYQLAGGTLIGALRHRGFIPWDDDADITMTRKEWRKFLAVCNNGALPKGRVLECQENNREYHNMVARYTDTTCTALHKTQLMHKDTAGFVIDILIYDGLPNKEEALEEYTRDLMLYSDLLNDSLVYSYRYRTNKFRYFWYRLQMKIKGAHYVLSKLEARMSRYDEDECNYLVLHWGGIPLVFNRKTFGESRVFVPIEDTMGQCPDRPFDYLVEHYGDEWMFIPPVTEQQSHEAVFNSDIPYPLIREEIYNFVSRKKTKRKYRIRKNITLTHMNGWQDLKDMGHQILLVGTKMEFNQTLREKAKEIEEYKNQHNYVALRNIFSVYIGFQNDRNTSGRGDYGGAYRYFHPILLEIPRDIFELILTTLFNTNSISIAKRFIEVYEYAKGTKTPYMVELENDICDFRQAVSHFAAKEYDEAYPLIDKLFQKHPENISIIKLKINALRRLSNKEETHPQILALAEKALLFYPEDGELMKYKLDTQLEENPEETLLGYLTAWDKTLNGLTRLDITDIVSENLDFYFDYCMKNIGKEIQLTNINFVQENEDEEDIIEGSFIPEELSVEQEKSVSVLTMQKLDEIVQDDIRVKNAQFELFKKIAESQTSPDMKAEAEYTLIKAILLLRRIYLSKFQKNEYSEIETLVTKWYYSYYKSLNNSDFVTLTSAELIANEDFENLENILSKVDKYMESLDKESNEYFYCMVLRGDILYRMGDTEQAYHHYSICAEKTKDSYLKVVLKYKFIRSLVNIYKELLSSYNKSYIHKSLESNGLSPEEYYSKTLNNKRRLVHFYKDRITRIYPTALKFINILKKTGALSKKDATDIIESCKIGKNSKLSLRTIQKLHQCIVGYTPDIETDSDFLEEISEKEVDHNIANPDDSSFLD